MEQNTQIAIYDITNPDSVIAAAVFSSVTNIKPVSVTSRPDLNLVDEVWFIGTEPMPCACEAHVFKFEYNAKEKNSKLIQISLPENEESDEVLGHPLSITYLVCNYLSSNNKVVEGMKGAAWVVGSALETFKGCEVSGGHILTDVELESGFRSNRRLTAKQLIADVDVPVIVYNNYYRALHYLENYRNNDFVFEIEHVCTDTNKKNYLDFMATLKARISRAWYAQMVSIDGKDISMPILYLEMDVIPFAMRFIAFVHDRVIIIGPDGAGSRCYVFTRRNDYYGIKKLIEAQGNPTCVIKW